MKAQAMTAKQVRIVAVADEFYPTDLSGAVDLKSCSEEIWFRFKIMSEEIHVMEDDK